MGVHACVCVCVLCVCVCVRAHMHACMHIKVTAGFFQREIMGCCSGGKPAVTHSLHSLLAS